MKTTRGTNQSYESFQYDPADRLTKDCYAASCDGASASIGFTYDRVGNRLTQARTGVSSPGTTTYDYDAADELTKTTNGATVVDYGLDADGNLATAGSQTFTFDVANRLRKRADGTSSVTVSYDGEGRRLGAGSNKNPYARLFFWDVNNPLPMLGMMTYGTARTGIRYTAAGVPLEVTSGTAGTVSSINDADLTDIAAINDSAWLYHDQIGSIVDTTDAAGTSQTTTSYEPFGAGSTTKLVTSPVDTLLGFTGEYQDPYLGLTHLRARDYDPTLGRFTAKDPITPTIDDPYVAAYVYASDRPGVYTDPSGEVNCQPSRGGDSCGGTGGGLGWPRSPSTAGRGTGWPGTTGEMNEGAGGFGATTQFVGRGTEFFRNLYRYGSGGYKELQSGCVRFYGEMVRANTPGTISGSVRVREWNPFTGRARTWFERVDANGKVRQVRPETGGAKQHYHFDEFGNYVGKW